MTKIISASMINSRRPARVALAATALSAIATALIAVPGDAQAGQQTLPLGDHDLPETQQTTTLAPGVTLMPIHRGDTPADPDEVLTTTTTRGPWNVHVLTIDPRRLTFTASDVSPGDPVGAGVYGGELLSEPTATNPIQREFVVDARQTTARIPDWSFSASVTNHRPDTAPRSTN